MKRYEPLKIEAKWQKIWQDNKTYQVDVDLNKKKMFVSGMFPYPSGSGLHVGHARSYSIVDAIARFYRQNGYNVMNPIGWDAFGLPAENYAIKNNIAPQVATKTNIANFKKQFEKLGISFDWSREINTTDPEYYRWTQWVFLQLYKRGLAYQKESYQWWCPVDKTVLANEQVIDGKCWRCGTQVEKKAMKQWFFKITDYADRLLEGLDRIDWPNKIKVAQQNWIGKSEGAEISFSVKGSSDNITVFSTRPETIFGATALILAPEHQLAKKLLKGDYKSAGLDYITRSLKRSEVERMSDNKDKTGVFTGSYVINPSNNKLVPIWLADYVLSGYGTGAIMAVPAHDKRDYDFAKKYNLPIIAVIDKPTDFDEAGPYTGEGSLINSGTFDGTRSETAREQIVSWLEKQGYGKTKISYKMRDWLISRQRYWGAPIPMVYCEKCGVVPIPEDQLPVMLPKIDDYTPHGDGKSALARAKDWINTTCPVCGGHATRETDTMDGYACSSWYLLRYCDPHNSQQAWNPSKANYWAPVDYYIGADHAIAHLLYARFWTKVFYDMGIVNFDEPINHLVYHGYVNASDGSKMSKSKGNVIDPLDLIDQGYGADSLRVYELFIAPYEMDAVWDPRGITGTYRFLNRVYTMTQEFIKADKTETNLNDDKVISLCHKTIKKVTSDLHRLNFNTAISALMEDVNELYKLKQAGFSRSAWQFALENLAKLLAPFAPHLACELWSNLGHAETLEEAGWPIWNDDLIKNDTTVLVVQVNGKLRARLNIDDGANEEELKQMALNEPSIRKFTHGNKPQRIIYIAKTHLINIVI